MALWISPTEISEFDRALSSSSSESLHKNCGALYHWLEQPWISDWAQGAFLLISTVTNAHYFKRKLVIHSDFLSTPISNEICALETFLYKEVSDYTQETVNQVDQKVVKDFYSGSWRKLWEGVSMKDWSHQKEVQSLFSVSVSQNFFYFPCIVWTRV